MVTAASLADWVTSALIASSTLMVEPCFNPSLVGAWTSACGVERHHLGEGGWVARRVWRLRGENDAGVHVDDNGRRDRWRA